MCCLQEESSNDLVVRDGKVHVGLSDHVFQIVIEKPGGKPLGLDVDITEPSVLRIVEIYKGPISDWNKINPLEPIEVGDFIVKVNGVEGVANKMLDRCRDDTELKLTLVRLSQMEEALHAAAPTAPDERASPATAASEGKGSEVLFRQRRSTSRPPPAEEEEEDVASESKTGGGGKAEVHRLQPFAARGPPSPCICKGSPIPCLLPWMRQGPAIQAAAWS